MKEHIRQVIRESFEGSSKLIQFKKDLKKHFPEQSDEIFEIVSKLSFTSPKAIEDAMDEINKIIDGYSIEVIRSSEEFNSYYGDIVAEYVNMGDQYTPTIFYDNIKKQIQVICFEDWVLKNQKKYKINESFESDFSLEKVLKDALGQKFEKDRLDILDNVYTILGMRTINWAFNELVGDYPELEKYKDQFYKAAQKEGYYLSQGSLPINENSVSEEEQEEAFFDFVKNKINKDDRSTAIYFATHPTVTTNWRKEFNREKVFNEGKTFGDYPYQMYYSQDSIAKADGKNSISELLKIARDKKLKEFSIFKNNPRFNSTTQDEYLVMWYDEKDNSYWSNRSKKEPELLDKKLKEL